MTITLQLTDGTTTLNLNESGTYAGVTYAPSPPRVSALDAEQASTSETATLRLEGTTSELQTAIQAIETLLGAARRRQAARSGPRVYVRYKNTAADVLQRSELLDGAIELDPDPGARQLRAGTVVVALLITRRAWWETNAETTLATGAMTNNGSSRLALGTPTGTMPAPVRVELTNTTGTISPNHFYMAINAFADVGNVDLTLPADSIVWSTAQDHSTIHYQQTLTNAKMADLAGERYFICVGLSSAVGNSYLQATVYTTVGAVDVPSVSTAEVYVGTAEQIKVLGPVALPVDASMDGAANVTLGLTLRDVSTSPTGSMAWEWVQLMPAASFRHIKQTGFEALLNEKWIDDGPENLAYYENGAGQRVGIMHRWGSPLRVYPNRANEFLCIFDEYVSGVNDLRTFSATVKYRPRRLLV